MQIRKAPCAFVLSVCGPDVWRPIKPGYFSLSWYGGMSTGLDDYPTPKEYKCWRGHWCEGKHHWPWHCVPGTYSNKEGTGCVKCPAGWPCPIARTAEDQLIMPCWPGHYCPEGSASPTARPCPAGTVNHNTAAEDETACKACPAGWTCSERAFQGVGFKPCRSGYYCREGSIEGKQCPEGTYAPYPGASDRMTSESDCKACVAGFYCLKGDNLLDMLSQPCPPGKSEFPKFVLTAGGALYIRNTCCALSMA